MTEKQIQIPQYVLKNCKTQTLREFKALKRKQLKVVKQALNSYRQGCAYSPAFKSIIHADELITKAIEAQSAKNWGR